MRYAILSDAHANLPALEAILEDISAQSIDHIFYLGDAIGYGPHANEILDLLKSHVSSLACQADGQTSICPIWIKGNHDWGLLADETVVRRDFNDDAIDTLYQTRAQLIAEEQDFLSRLPHRITLTIDDIPIVLVHASGSDPIGTYNYINNEIVAAEEIVHLGGQLNFVGHTHIPCIYQEHTKFGERAIWKSISIITSDEETESHFQLDPSKQMILNPGSVGQPRDGDSRASYGIFDSEQYSFTIRRIIYNIEATQQDLRTWLNLPNIDEPQGLAGRLAYGL